MYDSAVLSRLAFYSPAATEIYTLSLHDALPIYLEPLELGAKDGLALINGTQMMAAYGAVMLEKCTRSEEHTSELQSPMYLVCRLLLEKKNRTFPLDEPTRPLTPVVGVVEDVAEL